jgi:DNA modification methylase
MTDYDELAAYWPDMAALPDGEDVFEAQYGRPYGEVVVSDVDGYEIYVGDCIETMKGLEAGTVQTCVTSPPYFGLRNYDGGDAEIGKESTPEQYVQKLVEVFREVRRLLRDDGTLWLNLGDSYNGSGGAGGDYGIGGLKEGQPKYPGRNVDGLKPKDLIGIPWMVAFALRADGWYLRSDIIWHKPNPMPESVTDRPTKAHEYIFLLSKSKSYYYDADAIRENISESTTERWGDRAYQKVNQPEAYQWQNNPDEKRRGARTGEQSFGANPLGRNKRSVWTVTTKPYSGAHFATFPPDLIEPCILAGTSAKGCCSVCGAPWERVVEREVVRQGNTNNALNDVAQPSGIRHGLGQSTIRSEISTTTIGWQPTCTCNADVVPCIVLDPFNGAATTGVVALKHGRRYIGCELNPEYVKLSHERLAKSQPLLLPLA